MNLPASCVQVVNLPATYQLTVETERLMNVILCGPKGAMETLTPEQVVIEIDAEDFAVATGQQNIACRLYVPSNGKIFALGSYVPVSYTHLPQSGEGGCEHSEQTDEGAGKQAVCGK